VAGTVGSLLVGAATIVAGWHRPSDVAAALMVSAAWAGLVVAFVVMRPRGARNAPPEGDVPGARPEPNRRDGMVTIEHTARRTRTTVHR
jgi:hypothetical protein